MTEEMRQCPLCRQVLPKQKFDDDPSEDAICRYCAECDNQMDLDKALADLEQT